jgi:hypothetical protein
MAPRVYSYVTSPSWAGFHAEIMKFEPPGRNYAKMAFHAAPRSSERPTASYSSDGSTTEDLTAVNRQHCWRDGIGRLDMGQIKGGLLLLGS